MKFRAVPPIASRDRFWACPNPNAAKKKREVERRVREIFKGNVLEKRGMNKFQVYIKWALQT